MPKHGIHQIVLDNAAQQLLLSANPAARSAGENVFEHRGVAMAGAVGPDLFFWAPDYEIVDKVYRFWKNIEEIVEVYNRIVQPFRDIRDAVVEPVEDAVETLAPSTVALIRQAVEEMKETAELFKSTLGTGLFAGVISGANVITDLVSLPSLSATFFNMFVPGLQRNEPESTWYWFDMLHYRKTGDFARNLVARANDDQQKAFAHGYLSHITTDIVGHAYVNQVVTGPFRLHPQRHIIAENYMDTWKYDRYYGQSVNQTLTDRLAFPENLPSSVGDLLHQAFRDTYQGTPHPARLPGDGFFTRDQVDQTYEIYYEVLQIMKKMSISRPEEPFSGVAEVLADALRDVLEPPPAPPGAPTGACSFGDILSFGLTESSRQCYDEFFDQLEDWFEYITELLEWALETLLDLFDLLLALLLTLPISVLLAILYGIQLLLFEVYQTVRHVLALEGFIYPEPDFINDAHGRNLITPVQCGITPFKYPFLSNLSRSHLVCPLTGVESPTTAADFNEPAVTVTPDVFIQDLPFDPEVLRSYSQSASPEQTRSLERDYLRIGNATDLTAWTIATASDESASGTDKKVAFTNWNLDADRGYGYKTWRGTILGEQGVGDEVFVDGGDPIIG